MSAPGSLALRIRRRRSYCGRGHEAVGVGVDIMAPLVGVVHAEEILEPALEEGPDGLATPEERFVRLCALQRLRRRREEVNRIFAGEAQHRVGVARHEIDAEGVRKAGAELGRIGPVVVTVVVPVLARYKLVERRYRRVGRAKMLDVENVVEVLLRAAETNVLVESAERAALDRCERLGGTRALFGRDRNDAADRI